jgi:archaellum component FlaC
MPHLTVVTFTDQSHLGMAELWRAFVSNQAQVQVGVEQMAGVAESVISELLTRGVEKIASRKRLTSQDLTVLLLHEQGRSISRMEKGVEEIAGELREIRREVIPLLNQAKDIAEIKSRMERIEAKVS